MHESGSSCSISSSRWHEKCVCVCLLFNFQLCFPTTHTHRKLKDHFSLILAFLGARSRRYHILPISLSLLLTLPPSNLPITPTQSFPFLYGLHVVLCVRNYSVSVQERVVAGGMLKVTQARNDSHPLEFMIRKQFKLFQARRAGERKTSHEVGNIFIVVINSRNF